MLSIITPTTHTSKEKPRFLREKFVIRETDKRKKVIESDQSSLFINQDPKEVSISKKKNGSLVFRM